MSYTKEVKIYRQRLEDSINTFRGHKNSLRAARQATKQILPAELINQTTGYTDMKDAVAGTQSMVIHPMLAIINKKFIEQMTALTPRYEWQGNDAVGEAARAAAEMKFRTLYSQSNLMARMNKMYRHAIVDGMVVSQTLTYVKSDSILLDGKITPHNTRRALDLAVYDPINTYIDPNADSTDIAGTSAYIIVTLGIFDEEWIEANMPEYFKDKSKPSSSAIKTQMTAGNAMAWIDDNEDEMNAIDSGVDKETLTRYKVREYYTGNGYFTRVVNDEWMTKPLPVSNGVANRIPFNIVATIEDMDNPMGQSLYSYLKTSLILASKALNTISDNTEINNSMPFFTFAGSDVDGITITDFKRNVIVPMTSVQGADDIRKMLYRPAIPEVTQGATVLLQKSEEFMYELAGVSPSFITGQQDPQMRTDGISRMMQNAAARSGNSIATHLEQVQNGILWDFLRIFYIYYAQFNFNAEEAPRDFFKDFDNVRVVPGSYLPEDQMSRVERAQTVLNLAMGNPGGFELVRVYKDFLKAIGMTVPESVLKSAKENMMELLSQQIVAVMGEQGLNDPAIKQMLEQLAELAAADEDDEL